MIKQRRCSQLMTSPITQLFLLIVRQMHLLAIVYGQFITKYFPLFYKIWCIIIISDMYISAYFSLVEYIRLYSLTLPSIGTILKNTNGAKGHLTDEWEIIPRGLVASFSLYMIRNRDRALAKRITATNGIPYFPKINAHGLAMFCSGYIYRPIIPIYLRVTFIALGITRKRVNETQQEIT